MTGFGKIRVGSMAQERPIIANVSDAVVARIHSRRKFLTVLGIGGPAAFLAACGGGSKSESGQPSVLQTPAATSTEAVRTATASPSDVRRRAFESEPKAPEGVISEREILKLVDEGKAIFGPTITETTKGRFEQLKNSSSRDAFTASRQLLSSYMAQYYANARGKETEIYSFMRTKWIPAMEKDFPKEFEEFYKPEDNPIRELEKNPPVAGK